MYKSAETFIRNWLGTRHIYNGRTYEGVDCYGLVLRYYQQVLGVMLPDWKCESTSSAWISRAMDGIADEHFQPIPWPQDHCIALVRRIKKAHHIGVFYKGHILHCSHEGVRFEPTRVFQMSYPAIVYGVPCGSTAVSL